ncbi:putative isomerase YddE [Elizabethkingia miricola]|nr:putative isomerase YddE [Elizabethkingia miricola]
MITKNQIEVKILNAFVDNNKGGNPAGVVLNADQYTTQQKQKIACLIGLSETAFVSSSSIADFKLDFFTPTRQIAHCGHATIAVFSHLKQIGLIKNKNSSKETIDGIRKIIIEDDLAFMEQSEPKYQDLSKEDELLVIQSIGTDKEIVRNIKIVNTGNSFAIIHVDDINLLQTNFTQIQHISEKYDLIGYYVFALKNEDDRIATTRMFAPRYGIQEEAATGMAAGPLACFLYDILKIERQNYLIEQGWFMQKPSKSLLTVELQIENDKIQSLMVGGKGILMETKIISL